MLSTHPKQYQNVKTNLALYTAVVLALVGLVCYFYIIPTSQQQELNTLFGRIESLRFVGPGIVVGSFVVLGLLLIFVVEIHDKIYDRWFTKWRFWYDVDFILPTLFRPFANKRGSAELFCNSAACGRDRNKTAEFLKCETLRYPLSSPDFSPSLGDGDIVATSNYGMIFMPWTFPNFLQETHGTQSVPWLLPSAFYLRRAALLCLFPE